MQAAPPRSIHRAAWSAPVACTACRKLKMRCVGADDPPCKRCEKAKRQCTLPLAKGSSQAQDDQVHLDTPASGNNQGELSWPPYQSLQTGASSDNPVLSECRSTSMANASISNSDPAAGHKNSTLSAASPLPVRDSNPESKLPSIFSGPSTLHLLEVRSTSGGSPSTRTSPRSDSIERRSPVNSMIVGGIPNDQLLRDLIEFFNSRILHNLPFLLDETTENISYMIQHKTPLACSIAFVSAGFASGYQALRVKMIPHILDILKLKHCSMQESEENLFGLLQAFAVLYTYSPPTNRIDDGENAIRHGELSSWALKSTLETFSTRLSLHRSAEELRSHIEKGTSKLAIKPVFRRYLFWLWLFTVSHHVSVITRTPPTMNADSTIRCARDLLRDMMTDGRARRILAEVELCLVWGQIGKEEPGLGEWWCSVSRTMDMDQTTHLLEVVDSVFHLWRQKWLTIDSSTASHGPSYSYPQPSITFHYRFMRFCISTYATQSVQLRTSSSENPMQEKPPDTGLLSPAMIQALVEAINAASDFCRLMPTSLSPLQKDHARYLSDSSFAMMGFPCLYIIQASELLSDQGLTLEENLDVVQTMAEFLVQVGSDETHGARLYGEIILSRLEACRSRAHLGGPQTSMISLVGMGAEVPLSSIGMPNPISQRENENENENVNQNMLSSLNVANGSGNQFFDASWNSTEYDPQLLLDNDWHLWDTLFDGASNGFPVLDSTWNHNLDFSGRN